MGGSVTCVRTFNMKILSDAAIPLFGGNLQIPSGSQWYLHRKNLRHRCLWVQNFPNCERKPSCLLNRSMSSKLAGPPVLVPLGWTWLPLVNSTVVLSIFSSCLPLKRDCHRWWITNVVTGRMNGKYTTVLIRQVQLHPQPLNTDLAPDTMCI